MLKGKNEVSKDARKKAGEFVKSGSPICKQTGTPCDGCFGNAFEKKLEWNELCAYQEKSN